MSDMSELGGTDEQDQAEDLDDRLGGEDFPPDEPFGLPELLGRDVTVTGDYAPDSVEERTIREEASFEDEAAQAPFGLVDLAPDGETDLVAETNEPDLEDLAGLSEAGIARADDTSAEVAAMHVVDEG